MSNIIGIADKCNKVWNVWIVLLWSICLPYDPLALSGVEAEWSIEVAPLVVAWRSG